MSFSARKNYPHLAKPLGAFMHAEKHNGMLFLSGLTALGSPAQGRGIQQEAEAIFKSIASIARAERTDLGALLKLTVFITNLGFVNELRDALSRHFGDAFPSISLVQISRLFSPHILMEAHAVLAVA
jgi:2-iminobutanoate/2-iminopropanoate deaminase